MRTGVPSGRLAEGAPPPRAILHVGAPKCGSSSVQAALSQRPDMTTRDGRTLRYICATPEGVLSGAVLRARAAASPFGYASSPDLSVDVGEAVLAHAEAGIRAAQAEGAVPILSSEGWLRRSNRLRESGLLERTGGGVHVVFAVRPPIEWLNAAWWQWGAWTDQTFDAFVARNLPRMRWPRLAEDWAKVPGVDAVHLRLADRDVVRSFLDLWDVAPQPVDPVNQSLAPDLLAFLLRNRDLRPGPSSPEIEFRLARALGGTPRPADLPPLWAPSPDWIAAFWPRLKVAPRKLAPLLPVADRARMRDDPRWFGPEPYAGRAPCLPDRFESPEALTRLHDRLAGAVGAPAAPDPFPSPAEADPEIRALVDRLAPSRERGIGGWVSRLMRGR